MRRKLLEGTKLFIASIISAKSHGKSLKIPPPAKMSCNESQENFTIHSLFAHLILKISAFVLMN